MRSTMAYTVVEPGLVVLVHGPNNPADDEWYEYVQTVQRLAEKGDGTVACLVVTDGGTPNSVQRTDMNAAFQMDAGQKYPTAVVTESRMARGVVTALGWFNAGIKAFAPRQLGAALDYLGVTEDAHGEVRAVLEDLRHRLGLGPFAGA